MNETSIATLVAWGTITVFGVVFLHLLTKDEEKDDLGGYDERQLISQGKANKAGLTAGVVYLFLLQLADFWEDFPLSIQEVSNIGILIMILTFATVAIWKDAYLRLREKEGSGITWMLIWGLYNLIMGRTPVRLLMGSACCYVAFLIALRRHVRKREEREEADG